MYWSPAARRGIAGAVDAFRPDVVHLHNIYHHLSPSVLVPLRKRCVPAVMTLHDYKLACPTYLFLDKGQVCEACLGGHFHQAVRRRCKDGRLLASTLMASELALHTRLRAYDWIARLICPSRFMHAKMTAAGVYPDRLRLLHSFVDVVEPARPRDANGPVVYASRLWPEKGVDVLVEAAARLPAGLRVEIAGDGPERQRLEALAAARAPGRVSFHGRLSKPAVANIMSSASVVVAPSRCYENQPLMVLEAFAAGIPVVGSDLGGISELVAPGLTGALAPPNDPVALARAIIEVCSDSKRNLSLGRAARDLVRAEYSRAAHLAGLESLYTEAIESVASLDGSQR
jgi:glycosyltransferase involved in cell wall biosynthesis